MQGAIWGHAAGLNLGAKLVSKRDPWLASSQVNLLPMSIIETFLSTSKDLISWAARLQSREKEELIQIVGGLADEINRSLTLFTVYLDGIKINPDDRIAGYLRTGRGRVLQSFREFDVCGDLYSLRSRFGSLLDPATLSVNVAHIQSIGDLIQNLAGGERILHDALDDCFAELDGFAGRIEMALAQPDPSAALPTIRSELADRVVTMAELLRQRQRQIKETARALVDAIA